MDGGLGSNSFLIYQPWVEGQKLINIGGSWTSGDSPFKNELIV